MRMECCGPKDSRMEIESVSPARNVVVLQPRNSYIGLVIRACRMALRGVMQIISMILHGVEGRVKGQVSKC